ncbi:stabilin-2-like [Glandiceps talaboti]
MTVFRRRAMEFRVRIWLLFICTWGTLPVVLWGRGHGIGHGSHPLRHPESESDERPQPDTREEPQSDDEDDNGGINGRCDYTNSRISYTECMQCEISEPSMCPVGTQAVTTGQGMRDCTYSLRVLDHVVEVLGCRHQCEDTYLIVECCDGHWGPQCQECPGGSDNPCNGRGRCSDTITGGGVCSCTDGFGGEACDRCASTNLYGPQCTSVCQCVYGVCQSGIEGQGFCFCLPGYVGNNCDAPRDECRASNCPSNSHCDSQLEEGGRYSCACDDGYKEINNVCQEIDPCIETPGLCDPAADCRHTGPNQHNCTCRQGYEGDGITCTAINPCSTNYGGCPTNSSTCHYDAPGQFHCQCKWGYESYTDGIGCSLIDVCDNQCQRNADCTMFGPYGFDCQCKEGFMLQDDKCIGNIIQQLLDMNGDVNNPLQGQLTTAIRVFQQSHGSLLTNAPLFTVFVPNDDAFAKADTHLLAQAEAETDFGRYLYGLHIIPAQLHTQVLNGTDEIYTLTGMPAEVSASDRDPTLLRYRVKGRSAKGRLLHWNIPAVNGLIHVIDRVLYVEPRVQSDDEKTIFELVQSEGLFNRLEGMIQEADLDSLVHDNQGPFTVLAPNNHAFDSLLSGTLDYLATPEGKRKLVQLLENHIVVGAMLTSANLLLEKDTRTMQMTTLYISTNNVGLIQIKDPIDASRKINITQSNIRARNGYIHYIDGLLIPPSIMPLIKHRCDTEKTETVLGPCGDCLQYSVLDNCPQDSISTGQVLTGCDYTATVWNTIGGIFIQGCKNVCNKTTQVDDCCDGFYGESCLPCPGGFLDPCNGNGQCMEGISNNGTCDCFENFIGTACELCSQSDHYGQNCTQVCSCVHGICANGPKGSGKCKHGTCEDGFTGEYCEEHIHPCGPQLDQCHAHAQCDMSVAIRCVCNAGYDGDGLDCVSIDPCTKPNRGDCHAEAECVTTGPGANQCNCKNGWSGDGIVCVPIDNCQLPSHGGCDEYADCIFTGPGLNECLCPSGFMGDGIKCTATDTCLVNYGGCHEHATCTSTGAGTNICTCNQGFEGNGYICFGSVTMVLSTIVNLSSLYSVCETGGITRELADPSLNVTLFAPTNLAFQAMSIEDQEEWLNSDYAANCLRYHMIAGMWTYRTLGERGEGPIPSLLEGTDLMITFENKEVLIDGARIIMPNIPATNGIIHIIDEVLQPPDMSIVAGNQSTSFPTLWDLMRRYYQYSRFMESLMDYELLGVIENVGDYTLFVPSNDAFSDLAADQLSQVDDTVIKYHIIPQKKLLSKDLHDGLHLPTLLGHNYQLTFSVHDDNQIHINGQSFIMDADIQTDKGVIHGISRVLDVLANRCDLNHSSSTPSTCSSCDFPPVCPSGFEAVIPSTGLQSNCRYSRDLRGRSYTQNGCQVNCIMTEYTPNCCLGFYGPSCRACPGGAADPCTGHGVCNDGIGGDGICTCDNHFTGTACELCTTGFYGNKCDQVCPCINGVCMTSPSNSVICVCTTGWAGHLCNQSTTDSHRDCLVSCDINAFCGANNTCVCNRGYVGDGQQCQAQDLCEDHNGGCSDFATCVNIPGSRACNCQDGYSGDGVYCEEIDLCVYNNGGCHEHAECIFTGPNMRACNCLPGYQGNGLVGCQEIDPCMEDHGGCSILAICTHTGPDQRVCTCISGYIGNGITCIGKIMEEIGKNLNYTSFNSLYQSVVNDVRFMIGPGPFTLFIPNNQAFQNLETANPGQLNRWRQDEQIHFILEYHIIGCVASTVSDMQSIPSLTSMNGQQITISNTQDTVTLNGNANIVKSDFLTANGVIQEVDQILVPEVLPPPKPNDNRPPPPHNPRGGSIDPRGAGGSGASHPGSQPPRTRGAPPLEDIGQVNEYSIFKRLFEASGLKRMLSDPQHIPFTIFLPTNDAFNSLPDGKLDEIENVYNPDTLVEYMKYHMIRDRKMYSSDLIVSPDLTTMQGSDISAGCWGNQGDIYLNEGNSKLVERNLLYDGGIAHGIDRVLEPPSIGGRCDNRSRTTVMSRCGSCSFPPVCPPNGKPTGAVTDCRYRIGWFEFETGCRQECTIMNMQPNCCPNHYGADCRECPGGSRNPCNGHGTCKDGHLENGSCTCQPGFAGDACEICQPEFFGRQCEACQCSEHGTCIDGMTGDGSCFCAHGWTGPYCSTRLTAPLPTCDPPCHTHAVCRPDNMCECSPHYYGNGRDCTVIDRCEYDNGGCSNHADCNQTDTLVRCTCHENYEGDGIVCRGVDLCERLNGGCHSNATCRYTGPNSRSCMCNYPLVGDGITDCHPKPPEVDACDRLISECSENAYCLEFPVTDRNPYGGGSCVCKNGYVGNGTLCNGDMYETLASINHFSEFFTSIMFMESKDGAALVSILQDVTSTLTIFVPINGNISPNTTLTTKGIQSHIVSELQPQSQRQFSDGKMYTTMSGSVIHLTKGKEEQWYSNKVPILEFDIPTSNGILHVINEPLVKPIMTSKAEADVSENKDFSPTTRIVALVVVSIVVLAVVLFLSYIWYRRNRRKLTLNDPNSPIVCSRYISGGAEGGRVILGTPSTVNDDKPVFDNPLYAETGTSTNDAGS